MENKIIFKKSEKEAGDSPFLKNLWPKNCRILERL